MKKLVLRAAALLMILTMLTGFAACLGGEKEAAADMTPIPLTEETDPAAEATETPTETPTPAPTPAPAETPIEILTPEPTELPTEAPTEAPTEEPTQAPTATPTPTPKPTPAPTPAPTPTPKPTNTPKPATPKPTDTPKPTKTPKPTATPQPVSDGSVTFKESKSLPMPGYYDEDIPQGQPFTFGGVVKSDDPLLEVKLVITSSGGSSVSYAVSFDASDNVKSVELVDPTFPSSGNKSLTAKAKFENLSAGSYTFGLYATTTKNSNILLLSRGFKIVGGTWRQLISNNLRNNYAYALQFFGSRSEFMFTYKWDSGRQIVVESSWTSEHITSVTSPSGKKWVVHRKAAQYFQRAFGYLESSCVRVHGTNGDSGVLRLWDLVSTFDGTFNTRFVSDRSFVSHHAFATAVDLNASMDANVNSMSNRALIKSEVGAHLTYNGIKTADNGTRYYDFTYDGSHSNKYKGVPTTVINYLLYELAFYRAGFNWGYYYPHTCDGMHFGLSEVSSEIHDTSPRSLRKVYSYIG